MEKLKKVSSLKACKKEYSFKSPPEHNRLFKELGFSKSSFFEPINTRNAGNVSKNANKYITPLHTFIESGRFLLFQKYLFRNLLKKRKYITLLELQ